MTEVVEKASELQSNNHLTDNGMTVRQINQPRRPRVRTDVKAARRDDLLRTRMVEVLRKSGRFLVERNVPVPVTRDSRRRVRRASGTYLGVSLPCASENRDSVVLDLVVIDKMNRWAGGYALCWRGSRSARAKRRIERDLRAAELVLRSHLRNSSAPFVDTVTVGIIDGGVETSAEDDLTMTTAEVEDHFNIRVLPF